MNLELEKINTWFECNRLCLNVKKTKYILFHTRQTIIQDNLFITMNGQNIERIGDQFEEKCFKFLGLHIDEHLTWKFHIQKICKKIASANYIINKVKNVIPLNSLRNLYMTLVHCHLNYGLLLWGSSRHINQVAKAQKKSIRTIHNKPYRAHTEPLLKLSGVLNINLYKFNVLLFMHQLKLGKLPRAFSSLEYFKFRENQNTRYRKLAQCKTPRTTFTSLLPIHKFPRIWNELDLEHQQICSAYKFKRDTKALLLNKYRITVHCENNFCKQCYP